MRAWYPLSSAPERARDGCEMRIQEFDGRMGELVQAGAEFEAMPAGRDVAGGDTAGWRRGCDGPVWISELATLAFSDVGHSRRLTWTSGGDVLMLHKSAGGASGAARDLQGRFVTCEAISRRVTRLEADGSLTTIASE